MIDEELDVANENESLIPSLPVSLPGIGVTNQSSLPLQAYSKDPISVFGASPNAPDAQPIIMGGKPVEQGQFPTEGKAGTLAQIGHAFYKNNIFTQSGEALYNFSQKMLAAQDDSPFNQWDYNSFKDFPQQYWPDIANAVSNKDRARIQQNIRDQMDIDKRYENGSLIPELIGTAAGMTLGSVGALLPFVAEVEFAGVAQNVLRNTQAVAPLLAADSISRQALISANEYGQTMKSQAINTGVDFAFNILTYGAAKAFAPAKRNLQLWDSRKTVAMAIDEKVNIDFKVGENGEFLNDVNVTPAPGVNLSAAKVDVIRELANEQMQMSGLFSVPGGKYLLKALSFGSPVVKAATSPYNSVKGFFNRITSHGIITEGEAKGIATPDQAYTIASMYTDSGIQLGQFYKQKYYEANGIESSNNYFSALKNLKQTFSNEKTISSADFSKEYYRSMAVKDYKSPISQASEVAEHTHKALQQMNIDYNKSLGREDLFKDPRNAFRYTPLAHDVAQMIAKPELWQTKTANWYATAEQQIKQLNDPVFKTKQRIEDLKNRIQGTDKADKSIKNYKNQLAAAEKLMQRQQDELVENILANDDFHILLEDRVPFKSSEIEHIKQLQEPINKVQSKIDETQRQVDKLAKSKLKKEEKATQINELKKKIEKLESEQYALNEKLFEDAYQGKIPRHYWYEDQGMVKLHSPEFKPKFRDFPETAEGKLRLARSVFDSITSQTPEDLMYGIVTRHKDGPGSPDYLKSRTHLVPMEIYIEDGFLDPNVDKVLSSYYNAMGKVIGWNRAFDGFGLDYYVNALKEEHSQVEAKNAKIEDQAKREKANKKSYRDLKEAEKFMNETYKVYFGTYNVGMNQTAVQLSHALKNLVASAKLGSVPIYQLTELSYLTLKTTLFPFFSKGLKPMITSLYGLRNTPEWELVKKNAASFGIAQNHLTHNIGAWLEGGAQGQIRTGGFVSNAAAASDQLAHLAGDMYGINFLSNINEMVAANAYTSTILQAAFDHQAGTLSALQREQMAHLGIDLNVWGKRFIQQFEKHNGVKESGGYSAPIYEWSDLEAADRFRMSIRRAVSDTVVNRDPFSKPYFLANNPIASMVFMFHGWAYGALSRYTIPALQRADAKTAMGLAIVVGSSLLSEPLLRLANGKEMYDDDETWFQQAFKAVDYSGALGPSLTYLQDLNKISGNVLIPKLQSERAKNQPGFSGALGPVFGYFDNGARVASHAIKGNFTKGDAQSAARMLPLLSGLPQRHAINNILSQLDLPEDRQGAENWAWYNYLHGEQQEF